jgi:hypothetical protein
MPRLSTNFFDPNRFRFATEADENNRTKIKGRKWIIVATSTVVVREKEKRGKT